MPLKLHAPSKHSRQVIFDQLVVERGIVDDVNNWTDYDLCEKIYNKSGEFK